MSIRSALEHYVPVCKCQGKVTVEENRKIVSQFKAYGRKGKNIDLR